MKRQTIMLVDGYNIIGDWPELQRLKQRNLGLARDHLIDRMIAYQAQTKKRVIIVFDAHMQEGMEHREKKDAIEIVFTQENETADERIEKLVSELQNRRTTIEVATSDATEQWVTFGKGASRKSARELELELDHMERTVSSRVRKMEKQPHRLTTVDRIDAVTAAKLERIRRGL